MEDVPAVYARPSDPTRPVLCRDETSRQLLGAAQPPLPPAPGRPARHDPEYVRIGVANRCLATEPLRGGRDVWVSEQRTRRDVAHWGRHLVDDRSPDAERIVRVCA